MKGFININKSQGMSSAQAVAVVKKKLHVNCGHMGTLDPMASGILPIGLDKTSRLFPYLMNKTKTYLAKVKFGILTDTLDITGNVLKEDNMIVSKEQVESVLGEFVGEIDQVPPKYSAKCVNGKRGYQLARKGIDFSLEPKKVRIDDIKFVSEVDGEFCFRIVCGGGTYIRSLARDIALKCGTVGTLTSLCREECGVFNLKNAVDIEVFKNSDNPESYILPPDLPLSFKKIVLTEKKATKILNGVFEDGGYQDGTYSVYKEDEFWGVGEAKEGVLRIKSYVR